MKIAIVGYGHVGKAMHKLFQDAYVYDIDRGSKEGVNACEVAFVCVPTPMGPDGVCDTHIVEEVISWIECKLIVLRSTVRVGFTDEMMEKYQKVIVFQPEYYGETVAHPFADLKNQNWLSFGGTAQGIALAIRAYQQVINSNCRIFQASAKEVEFAKYMENSFFATKVIFCNEMYDIAEALGVNYNVAREIWLGDPRIGTSHTFVYPDARGYGGSCLPKDIAAIKNQANEKGEDTTLLDAVINKNKNYR